MDQVENIDRDRTGDRFGERDVNTQRVSEGENEVNAMLQEYDLGGSDRDSERSPPKLERVSEYRHPHQSPPTSYLAPVIHHPRSPPPPPLTMDISSVRIQPVSMLAQAETTSTYGRPRLNWPEIAKVNNTMYCTLH